MEFQNLFCGGRMKEKNELSQMFKIFNYLDIVLGLALAVLVGIINRKYLIISVAGYFVAALSFYINSYIVKCAFSSKRFNTKGIVILSYILRVVLISVLGLILFTYNKFYMLAYIIGFSFRFLTLLVYGLIIKK